jgi:hypothetical protein
MSLVRDVSQAFWMGDEKGRHKYALEGQQPGFASPGFASHVVVNYVCCCGLLHRRLAPCRSETRNS